MKLHDLETNFREIFEAYREMFLPAWTMPPFTVSRQGPSFLVTIGNQTIKGRLSAIYVFCGEAWAAATRPMMNHAFVRWLPSLNADGIARHSYTNLDKFYTGIGEILAPLAFDLLETSPEEGHLLSEQLVRSVEFSPKPPAWKAELERLPENHRLRIFSTTKVKQAFAAGSFSRPAAFKLAVPFLKKKDIRERLAAIHRLHSLLEYFHDENCLSSRSLVEKPLLDCLADDEPIVRERTLFALDALAEDLWSDAAYPESVPLLERLIAEGMNPVENLARLAEAHFAMGNIEIGKETWDRLKPLEPFAKELAIHANIFDKGDWEDWYGALLTRSAWALLLGTQGEDPCKYRRTRTAPSRPAGAEIGVRLMMVHRYLERALRVVDARVPADLAAPPGPVQHRGFQAQTYFVSGWLAEKEGRKKDALQYYQRAKEVSHALGLAWRKDEYDGAVERLQNVV